MRAAGGATDGLSLGMGRMAIRICVLDPSSPAEQIREWPPADGEVLVVGAGAGPSVARALSDVERILLIHRHPDRSQALCIANIVSGARPGTVVVRLPTSASLLATVVVALEATASLGADDLSVLSAINTTLASTVSGIWTRRVTRVGHPRPTLLQRLASMLPWGRGFVSLLGPAPRLVAARPGGGQLPAASGNIVIGASADDERVAHLVAWSRRNPRTPAAPPVPPIVHSVAGVYGRDGVEFVVLADAMSEPDPVVGRCPVCRLPVRSASCPLCHVRPRVPEVSRV